MIMILTIKLKKSKKHFELNSINDALFSFSSLVHGVFLYGDITKSNLVCVVI